MVGAADPLDDCLVLNTVAAARALLRRYDARLKPFGVTVQQFVLLRAVRQHPAEPVAVLAGRVHLDRTSLTRNLDVLERDGLVARAAGTGNARRCTLTPAGERRLAELLPLWHEAQAELRQGVTDADGATYLRIVRGLAQS